MALGEGFLKHPDNAALRAAMESGVLKDKDYFNQLLRLVYRIVVRAPAAKDGPGRAGAGG